MVESRTDCVEIGADTGQMEEGIKIVILRVRLWEEGYLGGSCRAGEGLEEGYQCQRIVLGMHSLENARRIEMCWAVVDIKRRGNATDNMLPMTSSQPSHGASSLAHENNYHPPSTVKMSEFSFNL